MEILAEPSPHPTTKVTCIDIKMSVEIDHSVDPMKTE